MFEVEEWLHSRIGLNFRSGLSRMQQAVDCWGILRSLILLSTSLGLMGKDLPCFYEGVIYGAWQKSCDLYLPSYRLYQ